MEMGDDVSGDKPMCASFIMGGHADCGATMPWPPWPLPLLSLVILALVVMGAWPDLLSIL